MACMARLSILLNHYESHSGLQAPLLKTLKNADVKFNKKTLLLIYNEESLLKRRRCVKGARLLAQDMRTHLLTNDPFKPSMKKRKFFDGANRGNSLVNIVATPAEELWVDTVPWLYSMVAIAIASTCL